MSWYLLKELSDIYHRTKEGGEYLFRKNPPAENNLRFLRDHGYIEMLEIGRLVDGQNLVGVVKLTPSETSTSNCANQ